MLERNEAAALIKLHLEKYPLMEMRDVIKLLFQSEFGCAHAIRDEAAARAWLEEELASVVQKEGLPLTEPLGGGYSRVDLHALKAHGMTPDELLSLFIKSAEPAGSREHFAKLLLDLIEEPGLLPFDGENTRAFVKEYVGSGCPAVHHSEAYNKAYSPAYRVVRAELVGGRFFGK
ncbi:MAG: hypothetical protein K6G56_08110 [Clostridiales bacterium]|nr:hypothetical protein [Clostridiales bacterium]